MFTDTSWLVPAAVLVAAAGVLLYTGPRMARVVDTLADVTGWGEAMAGAILLGAATSLPGLVTTVVAAAAGRGEFAVANALGGIAAQTLFIVIADLFYRRINLEHAAASIPNLLQSMIVMALLALVLGAALGPDVSFVGIHPVSPLLVVAYVYGLVLVRRAHTDPMWHPEETSDTRTDEPEEENLNVSLARLLLQFAGLSLVVTGTGFFIAQAGLALADVTPLSDVLVAVVGTAVVTSLPELVTTVAAIRQGALSLGVADILGGNAFDVLFVAAADVAFLSGSIYAATDRATMFLTVVAILQTAVLAAGLIHRERGGIGFEGVSLFVIYGLGIVGIALL